MAIGLALLLPFCPPVKAASQADGPGPLEKLRPPIRTSAPDGHLQELPPPLAVQQIQAALADRQPRVTILAPTDGTNVPNGNWTLKLLAQDWPLTDGGALGLGPHVVIQIDDQEPIRLTEHRSTPQGDSLQLTLPALTPGSHRITAYAAKHHFSEMHYLDIIDCNAGDHGKAFATNFNPEINIREITQPGRYWDNGEWVEIPAMSIHKPIDYPNIGPKESYVLYHEELESLVKNFPTLKRARFWMTFGQAYITHLNVLQNVGMTSITPIKFQGQDIVPLEFLKAVLPSPDTLGENYTGETSIGCQIKGIGKDGAETTYYVWNNCKHQDCWQEVQAQGVSYTTGVPAMIGAMMMIEGQWLKPGVWNCEELNPDPFMAMLNVHGLPWHEAINIELPHEYPA